MIAGRTGGEETLRMVIEALAPLERAAGSEDEHRAATWIAERLRAAGCETAIERGAIPRRLRPSHAGAGGGLGGGRGDGAGRPAATPPEHGGGRGRRRRPSPTTSPTAPVCSAGRPARRRTTWNVVGRTGDETAPRTLVVLAHHDAALTGKIFDPGFQTWLGETLPGAGGAHRHVAAAVVDRCWPRRPWWRSAQREDAGTCSPPGWRARRWRAVIFHDIAHQPDRPRRQR